MQRGSPQRGLDNAPPLANLEAECAVLGRIINDNGIWFDVCDRLAEDDFAEERNRSIWRAMAKLFGAGRQVSSHTLIAEVGERGESLATYLAGLSAGAAQPENASALPEHLAEIVLHHSARRALILAADHIRDIATTAPLTRPIEDIRSEAQKLIAVRQSEMANDAQSIGDVVNTLLMDTQKRASAGGRLGIRTGLLTFDRLVGPMMPGQLIILAGETSSGKTALAMQLAYGIALKGPYVHIASLEMTAEELAARYLTRFSGLDSERILTGELANIEIDRMAGEAEQFLDLRICVDDQPRQTVGMIEARIARSQAKHGASLAIVDHLQYIRADDARADERGQVTQVVNDIKAAAKRRGLPVILVSHIARPFESKPIRCAADIRMPRLSILHGSSAIEKAADVVVFVHRRAYFLERENLTGALSDDGRMDLVRWQGKAELVLLKRRMGRGHGVLSCAFDEQKTWFTDTMAADDGFLS